MKLSAFTSGRDNNFNLIRIIAAFAVLLSHSFALATGTSAAEPFQETLGMTLGVIAVDVFFITSGFLVTGSLLTRKSFIDFLWARVLRIFPALLVMLILVVFGAGLFFTKLAISDYLSNSAVYQYLLKCGTLISGVAFNLPGVFEDNPYKNAVNGSLWTMPYEIRMYVIVAVAWLFLGALKNNRMKVFKIAIITSYCACLALVAAHHFYFPTPLARFFLMFFSGASFFILRNHINLSNSVVLLGVVGLVAAALINAHLLLVLYIFTIAYVLFYLAYIPAGFIRKYNNFGDYSYGIYIYAFPVQQSVAALMPGVSVLTMLLVSGVITLLLAILSWHLIERRALSLKGHCVGRTYRLFAYR